MTKVERKVKGMTLTDHIEMGAFLQQARSITLHLTITLNADKKYGQKEADKTQCWIDKLRSRLEDKLYKDFPKFQTEQNLDNPYY